MKKQKVNQKDCYALKDVAEFLGLKPDTARKQAKANKAPFNMLKMFKDDTGKIWIPAVTFHSLYPGSEQRLPTPKDKDKCGWCFTMQPINKLSGKDGKLICDTCKGWVA